MDLQREIDIIDSFILLLVKEDDRKARNDLYKVLMNKINAVIKDIVIEAD
jgi:hypothetical protein